MVSSCIESKVAAVGVNILLESKQIMQGILDLVREQLIIVATPPTLKAPQTV